MGKWASVKDRELLELAAKVAELGFVPSPDKGYGSIRGVMHKPWNPLHDDGDAFRLAHKLGIQIKWFGNIETVRRAIVSAAAEIGRKMP